MEYNKLFDDFFILFPDDKEEITQIMQNASVENTDGMHIIFGMVVMPFVQKLLKEKKDEELRTAFDYFEKMAVSSDTKICEVLEFTILEDIISKGNIFLNECKKYMGQETLECCVAVEKYMM